MGQEMMQNVFGEEWAVNLEQSESENEEDRRLKDALHEAFGDSEDDDDDDDDDDEGNEQQQQRHPPPTPNPETNPALRSRIGRRQRSEESLEDETGGDEDVAHPKGPPVHLHLEIPARPPAETKKMSVVRASNVVGIEAKPFEPKTWKLDDEGEKSINTVRWRKAEKRNGSVCYESNARFVKWSDGSIQLLIGKEALDVSVAAECCPQHLFVGDANANGILQCEGRVPQRMRFMPSSLSSNSHRLLAARLDNQFRKTHKLHTHAHPLPNDVPNKKRKYNHPSSSSSSTTTLTADDNRPLKMRRMPIPLPNQRSPLPPSKRPEAVKSMDQVKYDEEEEKFDDDDEMVEWEDQRQPQEEQHNQHAEEAREKKQLQASPPKKVKPAQRRRAVLFSDSDEEK